MRGCLSLYESSAWKIRLGASGAKTGRPSGKLRAALWAGLGLAIGVIGLAGSSAKAQSGQWVWVGGSNSVNQSGVYGSLGNPAAGNAPGSRRYALSWTDNQGNTWLFGGSGYDAYGNQGALNDLWKYNPSTNQWVWMGGSSTIPCVPGACTGHPGVYGALGVPASTNIPGARYAATTWTDNNGNLWLFGGTGYDANGNNGWLNDVWEYNTTTQEWAWMGGSNINIGSCEFGGLDYCAAQGQYGTLGTAAAGNIPTGRMGAVGWKDTSGNLWLFGGETMVEYGVDTRLNDLWEYNPTTNQWAWMGGSIPSCTLGVACDGTPSVYGSLGVAAPGNYPSARWFASSWTDSNGKFWLFGGEGIFAPDCGNLNNDLWEYNLPTNEWTWMGGSNQCLQSGGQSGTYGTLGTPAAGNTPGSREYASTWVNSDGTLFLMGGLGYDGNGAYGDLNDLWILNPANGQWSWIGGSDTAGQIGIYGIPESGTSGEVVSRGVGELRAADQSGQLGISPPSPGSRDNATGWIDNLGNIWLFGGEGLAANSSSGFLGDLWVYQVAQTATPTFSVAPGTYSSAQTVTISDATPGANIYCTTDGTTPTTKSSAYSGSITVSSSETLQAIARSYGFHTSAEGTAAYTIQTSQTISFTAPPSPVVYGVSPITLSATSSSGLPVVFGVLSGQATVSGNVLTILGAGSVVVAANQSGNGSYAAAPEVTQTIGVNKAAPTITWATPAAITYGTTLSATQLNATASVPGTFIYNPAAGTVPAVGSDTLSASFTPTDATDYATATASVTLAVTNPVNPGPVIGSLSPALASAGGSAFTLTVTGSGFVPGSTVYWGASALVTTYGSATQLTAAVTSADIASAGITPITVQTPTPGGGTSSSLQFEVDSAGSGFSPTFVTLTASVTPGSNAAYSVTLPSSATDVSVTCLNLPTGASCSYSSATGAVTIATSSTTPAGTYQITVVFNETLPGAATGFVLLPLLLLPVLFIRRKLAAKGIWLSACVVLGLMAGAAYIVGCGGGGATSTPPPPSTHQATSSGVVTLTVQ
jgi:N-acetylneuraminic acid mutarotase